MDHAAHAATVVRSVSNVGDGPEDGPDLAQVQGEFPGFAVWRESTGERVRYHARSVDPGIRTRAVVTADLAELRAVLRESAAQPPPGPAPVPSLDGPNIARMYSFWQGGKDHLTADRAAAGQVLAGFPEVAQIARANRQFVTRAVAHVAAQGVGQFVDVGAGLPMWPAVHEVAAQHAPGARTLYLDCDELVLVHARALLAGPDVAVARGDLRDPAGVLGAIRDTAIDLGRPVCLLLAAVLHFLGAQDADAAVAALTAALAPGSFLVISAGTSTGTDPALLRRLRDAYAGATVITARTEPEIAAWFTGLDRVPPGIVDVRDWRPRRARPGPARVRSAARFLAGVARKPGCRPGRGVTG